MVKFGAKHILSGKTRRIVVFACSFVADRAQRWNRP
jgi:hypothetical protein